MRRMLLVMAMVLSTEATLAQSDTTAPLNDDVPMEIYLDALTQISPAAREGADTYLESFKRRCNRALKTVELRAAVADGSGDPLLMAMMRAAFQSDSATLQRLSNSISCVRRK